MKNFLFILGIAFSMWGCAEIVFPNETDWQFDVDCQYEGVAALRSAVIDDSGSTQFSITVEGVESFCFAWKIDSEANFDTLTCWVDGSYCLGPISGDQDWEIQELSLDSGQHTISWEYAKDGSASSGEDCAWIWFDGIEGAMGGQADPEDPIEERLPWTSDRTWEFWTSNTGPFDDGCMCLVSPGDLAQGESSSLSLPVVGRRLFEFWWFSSSGSDANRMTVAIDGVVQTDTVKGYSAPWAKKVLELPDIGEHVITWTYETNEDTNWGDVGFLWFEQLREIAVRNCETSPFLPWETGTGWFDGSLMSPRIDDKGGSSYISFPIQGEAGEEFSCQYKVSSEDGQDFLNVYFDGVLQEQHCGEQEGYCSFRVSDSRRHIVRFEYCKDENGLSGGEDRAWIYWDSSQLIDISSSSLGKNLERICTPSEKVSQAISLDLETTRAVQRAILNGDEGVAGDSGSEWNCWKVDMNGGYNGSALRSAELAGTGESWMSATVIGNGTFSFNWKVSSRANGGVLRYYLDGQELGQISGTVDWRRVDVVLDEDARHVIKWVYQKTVAEGVGSDCGWVDGINWDAPSGYDDPDEPVVPAIGTKYFTLDLTASPEVLQKEELTEPKQIVFNPDWAQAASVVMKINGVIVQTSTTAGTYDWMPSASGTYVLTLEQLDAAGNAVAEPLSHTFVVKGTTGAIVIFY